MENSRQYSIVGDVEWSIVDDVELLRAQIVGQAVAGTSATADVEAIQKASNLLQHSCLFSQKNSYI